MLPNATFVMLIEHVRAASATFVVLMKNARARIDWRHDRAPRPDHARADARGL
jgi:hypothetical protein